MDMFRTENDTSISRIFLEHDLIFADKRNVSMMHSPSCMIPNPYTAKFVSVGVRINKHQQMRRSKINRTHT